MSRIYEALQRAELDRKGAPDPVDDPFVAPTTVIEAMRQ